MISEDDTTGQNPTTTPAANNGADIEQLQRDIERYKRAYLLSEDARFRKALTDIIEELEKRLRAKRGEDGTPQG
jgi:hypothetical protein